MGQHLHTVERNYGIGGEVEGPSIRGRVFSDSREELVENSVWRISGVLSRVMEVPAWRWGQLGRVSRKVRRLGFPVRQSQRLMSMLRFASPLMMVRESRDLKIQER